jgi:hypothetical protein
MNLIHLIPSSRVTGGSWKCVGFALAVALGGGAGCEEKKVTLAPVASALASSQALPPSASVRTFAIDPSSKTAIELDAPKEKIKAQTTAGSGTIEVDLVNVTRSRGTINVDLSTLSTSTFGDASKDSAQTTHARTWLEVADGESGKLDDQVKTANRYATYAIRSISNASASDVTKLPATREGADDVRTVQLTSKGELLVHSHKVEREVALQASFHYDAGAPADKPKSLWITTTKPIEVTLADHDVKPRDGFGKLAKGSFHLLGTKVADVAEISLDLRATPAS